MIETNIVDWVDLGENIQNLEVYSKKRWQKFFNMMCLLLNHKKFSVFFYLVLNFLFYLQIIMLTLTNMTDTTDSTVKILNYISDVVFLQNLIIGNSSYRFAVILKSVLTLIILACIIYIVVSNNLGKFFLKMPIIFLNFIFLVLLDYLIGPIIQIAIMSTNCVNNNHLFLEVACYSSPIHIVFLLVSIINLIFYFILSVTLSIYYNEIGSLNDTKLLARTNCNYEIVANIVKIFMFVFAYIVKYYMNTSNTALIILQVFICVCSISFSLYVYHKVLFYDYRINAIKLYGWIFSAWFSFVIVIKSLLGVNDTTVLHIMGWLILTFIVYYMESFREEYILTDFNVFEAKSIKEVELFNYKFYSMLNLRSLKTKTLLVGVIKKFKEYIHNNDELSEKLNKLYMNNQIRKKFSTEVSYEVILIMYLVYDYHFEKSVFKNEILFNFSYFLIDKFKNNVYAMYLLSKVRVNSHKQIYNKFIIMEEIKYFLSNKLAKSKRYKESLKHIQIGSVILYNTYLNSFKMKIATAVTNQIDYFDTLMRSNTTTPKSTENFLKLGEEILIIRKIIIKLWERIIELNSFADEAWKEYQMYLETIIQDDILLSAEQKKFYSLQRQKLGEKNNVYNSMFNNNSCILLIDGYINLGKVLYLSPNFQNLYHFNGKDLINLNVDDFVPLVLKDIHKEVIETSMRYSNLGYIFNHLRDMLLRNKSNGTIYNVKLYIKCVPNMKFGLIYIACVIKTNDPIYIAVLDREFRINGVTDEVGIGTNYSNNYNLERHVLGNHIGLVVPEVLLNLEYREDGFHFPNNEIDHKGYVYTCSIPNINSLKETFERILENIRITGKLIPEEIVEDGVKTDGILEYEEFVRELNNKCERKHSVFFKIDTRTFLQGKHKYHRMYISNDLISMNENTHTLPSFVSGDHNNKLKSNKIDQRLKATKMTVGEVKPSQKQIKIKMNQQIGISGEENNRLIEENEKFERLKKIENEKKNNDTKNDENGEKSKFSSNGTKSAVSRSSVDSSSFYKLKNGILEKKEVSSIKTMKYLSLLFGISSFLLLFFATQNSDDKFQKMDDFLMENLYFNHSKISVACVYLATSNLKLLKEKIYFDSRCYKPCREIYSSLLSECISDIKTEKENSTTFYTNFTQILSIVETISLEVYNITTPDKIQLDIDSLLNLIVSYGLQLNSGLGTFLNTTDTTLNTVSNNLMVQTYDYLKNSNISGLNDATRVSMLSNSHFSPTNIVLVAEVCLFLILIFFYIYFICSLYRMESYYLNKLIRFKHSSFDLYLKSLEEKKKMMKNDNTEEEEENLVDGDMQEINSKKSDGKDTEKEKKKEKKKKKEEGKEEKNKEREKRKARNHSKANKNIKTYIDDKVTIMGKYFLGWNILFCIKVVLILFLSASYYIVVSFIDQSTLNEMINFDYTVNAIEGVYKNCFDVYLTLKTELDIYAQTEYDKKISIEYLKNNPGTSITINGQVFSDVTNVEKYHYTMSLPQQLQTPTIGNLLMPLVNKNLLAASNATNELNNLYNVNACSVLFDQVNESNNYNYCTTFWSSILAKGMEQSITQMNVVGTTVLDDLQSLNLGTNTYSEIIALNSTFTAYEYFVEYFLFKGYMHTVGIFRTLNQINLQSIFDTYKAIMIGYICFCIILFCLLLVFVYKSKSIFNSFMNFIGIMPVKYIIEDIALYRDILKLERYIY